MAFALRHRSLLKVASRSCLLACLAVVTVSSFSPRKIQLRSTSHVIPNIKPHYDCFTSTPNPSKHRSWTSLTAGNAATVEDRAVTKKRQRIFVDPESGKIKDISTIPRDKKSVDTWSSFERSVDDTSNAVMSIPKTARASKSEAPKRTVDGYSSSDEKPILKSPSSSSPRECFVTEEEQDCNEHQIEREKAAEKFKEAVYQAGDAALHVAKFFAKSPEEIKRAAIATKTATSKTTQLLQTHPSKVESPAESVAAITGQVNDKATQVQASLEATSIENSKKAVEEVEAVSDKIPKSLQDTKEGVDETKTNVKVMVGAEKKIPTPPKRPPPLPATAEEMAWKVAGGVATATAKTAWWVTESVAKLSFSGAKLVADNVSKKIEEEGILSHLQESVMSHVNTISMSMLKAATAATDSINPKAAVGPSTTSIKTETISRPPPVTASEVQTSPEPKSTLVAEPEKPLETKQQFDVKDDEEMTALDLEVAEALRLAEEAVKIADQDRVKLDEKPSLMDTFGGFFGLTKQKDNIQIAVEEEVITSGQVNEEAVALEKEVSEALQLADEAIKMADQGRIKIDRKPSVGGFFKSTTQKDDIEIPVKEEVSTNEEVNVDLEQEVSDALRFADEAIKMADEGRVKIDRKPSFAGFFSPTNLKSDIQIAVEEGVIINEEVNGEIASLKQEVSDALRLADEAIKMADKGRGKDGEESELDVAMRKVKEGAVLATEKALKIEKMVMSGSVH